MFTWQSGDGRLANSGTDMASATGLGTIGSVRAFEPPHTGSNYLTKEMVHVVGRKHASKLRIISPAMLFTRTLPSAAVQVQKSITIGCFF